MLPQWCLPKSLKSHHLGCLLQSPNLDWGTLEPLGILGSAIFRLISCSTPALLLQAPHTDFPSNQIHVSPVPALVLGEVSTGCSQCQQTVQTSPSLGHSCPFPNGSDPNLVPASLGPDSQCLKALPHLPGNSRGQRGRGITPT